MFFLTYQNNCKEFVVVSEKKMKFLPSPDGNGNPFLRARLRRARKKDCNEQRDRNSKEERIFLLQKKNPFQIEKEIIFGSKFCLKLHFGYFTFDD